MKALVYHGIRNLRVDDVPDPEILAPTDAIVRVTSTAICGSDLHLVNGYVPTVKHGDILGHEFMGIVEEIGSAVQKFAVGDRVIVPFTISCGACNFCKNGFVTLCDNSNPNAEIGDLIAGHSPAGLYGYSHAYGGYPGGQANAPASSLPTRTCSAFRTTSRTNRCSFSPTSFRRAIKPRRTATLSPVTSLRCGAAARSASSRS